jgi:hypothetical protein
MANNPINSGERGSCSPAGGMVVVSENDDGTI